MQNKYLALLCSIVLIIGMLVGCGDKSAELQAQDAAEGAVVQESVLSEDTAASLEDGKYLADFNTDSSMFHVNETCEGKGVLTVEQGKMTIHIVMPSKNVLNLYYGKAEDAALSGAVLIEPTTEEVTYSDGATEEVYAFDVPVPFLDEEFDCALIGKKGVWYDHKVSVSNAVSMDSSESTVEVSLSGGSGRASVESPAALTKDENGTYWATIVWSSPHYEYMLLGDTQYDPVQTQGNSTFIIPVAMDEDIKVSALTVAMSEPHLIDYTLHFDSSTIK